MEFRKDINGLRAIAVIAVVLFHFNPTWISGGFAGVDVFFVISGYLMTGIIFKGFESKSFNIYQFYSARANRIIPALVALCSVLLILGWFFLLPDDYKVLAKHAISSLSFLSNILYVTESGYFDAVAHDKWLLHTWSLSVEWQFYIVYPAVLLFLYKRFGIDRVKKIVLYSTGAAAILGLALTFLEAESAYFLLTSRAWEMLVGAIAFLYPLPQLQAKKHLTEGAGLTLILLSYWLIDSTALWPGYLALLPVVGSYLIIQASRNNSLITSNLPFQLIGKWSYSIYLWHWPVVVVFHKLELEGSWVYLGIMLSIALGYLSFTLIEQKRFVKVGSLLSLIKSFPLSAVYALSTATLIVYCLAGVPSRPSLNETAKTIEARAIASPLRKKCHWLNYQDIPVSQSCEYFSQDVSWAVIGDSHAVEVAYALGQRLQPLGQGVQHFSFSSCPPSYGMPNEFSHCTKWTNEVIEHVSNDIEIQNIAIIYRYSAWLMGKNEYTYPNLPNEHANTREDMLAALEHMIRALSKTKSNVYVYLPVPEIARDIRNITTRSMLLGDNLENIKAIDKGYYDERNHIVTNFLKLRDFPNNVRIIETSKIFCDATDCFAVKNGMPLYFDDDHPSLFAAQKMVDLIPHQINVINK